jgi:hypothetical protein
MNQQQSIGNLSIEKTVFLNGLISSRGYRDRKKTSISSNFEVRRK